METSNLMGIRYTYRINKHKTNRNNTTITNSVTFITTYLTPFVLQTKCQTSTIITILCSQQYKTKLKIKIKTSHRKQIQR